MFTGLGNGRNKGFKMKKKRYGFLAAGNLNIECLGEICRMGDCSQYNHLLNKFPDDQVFLEQDGRICFLNGYIYNKTANWPEAFARAIRENAEETLRGLRGGFGGYLYDQKTKELLVYTDQIAVKPVYYYVDGDKWMVSDRVDDMVAVLKYNGLACDFQPLAAQYMLTYGYMIDDTTFVRQIRRLLPGKLLRARAGQMSVTRYHLIQDVPCTMSEEEAVEKIDAAFREAVRREFEKDREYGYRHLVDLSGGLDSRMVSWVAHDLGYTDQVNVTYCRDGYRDEKIARQIALHLGHEYLFKPLDDGKWMYDIDEMTSQNNGAALYMGMTGGRRLLEMINTSRRRRSNTRKMRR